MMRRTEEKTSYRQTKWQSPSQWKFPLRVYRDHHHALQKTDYNTCHRRISSKGELEMLFLLLLMIYHLKGGISPNIS